MLRLLIRIDTWIIERLFQPVCDRLAGWTTPNRIGSFFLTGAVLATLAAAASAMVDHEYIMTIPYLILAALWSMRLYLMQRYFTDASALPTARITDLFGRLLYLSFAIVLLCDHATNDATLRQWQYTWSWILMTISMYFFACRRNPPKQRKARVWSTWLQWRPA